MHNCEVIRRYIRLRMVTVRLLILHLQWWSTRIRLNGHFYDIQ